MRSGSRANLEVSTAIVRGLMRARGRLAMEVSRSEQLPPELAEAREHIGELDRGSRGKGRDYPELLYAIGVVLVESRRPLSMGELSGALKVPMSTATRIVEFQVRHGYVERLSDPNDRRVVLVTLTPAGRALYDSVESFLAERLERGVRGFTAAERKQLAVLLEKLTHGLAEAEE